MNRRMSKNNSLEINLHNCIFNLINHIMKTKLYILLGFFYAFAQLTVLSQDGYILWVRDQANDQAFIDTLAGRGINVQVKNQTYRGVVDATKLDSANAARLIIMSRSCLTNQYNEPAQWNGFTAPLICLSPWLIRSNRWLWFDTDVVETISTFIIVVEI